MAVLDLRLKYHVMRRDENGNESIVGGDAKPACFLSPEAAGALKRRLEAGGHKQTYWVDTVSVCPHHEQ